MIRSATCTTSISSTTTDEERDHAHEEPPPHPGLSVRQNCLAPLELSVTEAAQVLEVARHTLSRVLNGHAAISPDMAIRLEKAGWSQRGFLAASAGPPTTWHKRVKVQIGYRYSDTSHSRLFELSEEWREW